MTRPVSRRPTTIAFLILLLVTLVVGPMASAINAEPAPTPGDATPELPVIETSTLGGIDARSAALLLSGQQSGDVPGALTWTLGSTDEGGLYDVPFVIEVDGASLIAGHTGPRIAIGLFTYAIDVGGRIVGHAAEGVVLDAKTYASAIAERGLRFIGHTTLPPGSHMLRVMVQARGSNRFFMAQSRLVIPHPDEINPVVLTSVFPDPGGDWVTIRQHGVATALAIEGAASIVQAARPVLLEGRPTDFFVGGAGLTAPTLAATLTDQAGRVLAEFPIEMSPSEEPSATLRRASLPVIDLPPGRYTLVLEAPVDGPGIVARQSLTIALVEGDGPYSWLDRAPPSATVTSPTASRGIQAESRFRSRKVRAAYIEAVRTLADGNPAAARQQLMTLERIANSKGELRSLRRVEDSVAGQLAAANPKSLLPIALLHQQLVRRYVARNAFVLASYARSVAADRAVQISNHGGDNAFAAALLVNLASDLARTATATLAVTYLEEALEADPTSRAALLALGVISERGADYDQAGRFFGQLVASHPDFAEGRLRLAVNLARSGKKEEAEKEFRLLLAQRTPPWVNAICAQEYARFLNDQQRQEEARPVLQSASKRLPSDQRLWILAAFTADAEGESLRAVKAILQIPPAEAGSSPRVRYTEWPNLGAAASAALLRETAKSALPALSAALRAAGGPG